MNTPMSNEPMHSVIKDLQDATIVLAHIEQMRSVDRDFAPPDNQSEKLRARIDKNLAEITEKLNRLIGPQ
jgi:hypothetical protein